MYEYLQQPLNYPRSGIPDFKLPLPDQLQDVRYVFAILKLNRLFVENFIIIIWFLTGLYMQIF